MSSLFFNFIFSLSTNPVIAGAAVFLNKFTYVFLVLIIVWVISFATHKLFTILLLLVSSGSAWIIAHTLKLIFHVSRPFVELGITPLVYQSNYSFPSEHCAVFSALAVSMFFIHKRAGVALGILAVLVGLSRIILGVHYPIDVLGGFLVGSIVAILYVKLFKKI
ncbi:MAG: phosphatase PAP2 family protein [bacterium]